MVDQHRPSTLIGRRQEGLYFPKSSLHSKNISLRLPELMLEALQLLAHKRDVSYQSIIKIFRGKRGLPVFRSGDQAVRTLGKYIQSRLHAREIVLELSTL